MYLLACFNYCRGPARDFTYSEEYEDATEAEAAGTYRVARGRSDGFFVLELDPTAELPTLVVEVK